MNRRPQYITDNMYLNDNKCKRWPRMVISRKDGMDITYKCWMKITERATTVRAKNWRRGISDIRRGDQKAAGYKMKVNKTWSDLIPIEVW